MTPELTTGPAVKAPEEDIFAMARAAFQHARAGQEDALRELLDRGLPADVCNDKGDSLLMLASYHGGVEASRLLLQRGADPDLVNGRGQTPLAGASFKGNVALVKLLLDYGAKVDGTGPEQKTALMFASMFDRLEVVELLLARGADAARCDASGNTARTLAEAMGAQRSAARLARNG